MRARSCDLSAAFIAHTENEMFLHQCYVPVWRNGILGTHDPYRNRKILAKRREIDAWNLTDPELAVVRATVLYIHVVKLTFLIADTNAIDSVYDWMAETNNCSSTQPKTD